MRKTLYTTLATLLLSLFASVAFSQSYYYQLTYGPEPAYYWATAGTTILSSNPSNQNDVLSASQSLPFAWNFYGAPVSSYKVSDNGYITFDGAASISYPNNTAIPNVGGPNAAIYAFWDDIELVSYSGVHDRIATWTYGTTPNRVHVIQWNSVTPFGTAPASNYMSFAIRIFEQGDFDIVHNLAKSNGGLTGTIGVENAAGNDATMEVSSPFHNFPTIFPVLQEDMRVYKFYYGTAPAWDLSGEALDLPAIADTGSAVTIAGTVLNYGTQTVTSMNLNYTVDGGSVMTANVSGLSIPTNGSYNFSHSIPWTATGPNAYHTVTFWASNLNGNPDQVNGNDTVSQDIWVNLGNTAFRRVLLEEFSTAPCGWCPRGHLYVDSFLTKYPDLISFAHHSGYLSDDMTIPESVTIADEFAFGAPTGAVDRVLWPGELYVGLSTSDWEQAILDRFATRAAASVSVSHFWDSNTRDLDIEVNIGFVDYPLPGDLRISVFIIEDHVTGTGAGYDQVNYYNADPTSPYYNLGDPIVGYDHRHVIRDMATLTWGEAGVVATNPGPGNNYTRNYIWNVPASYKEDDITVVASLGYAETDFYEVINAAQTDIITHRVAGPSCPELSLYPNPARDHFMLESPVSAGKVAMATLFNAAGKVVRTQVIHSPSTRFEKGELPAGIYFLQVVEGDRSWREKVVFE
ncbi:MAG: Omp28-related outer membrane protein [Bacteroidia bacterium]|nr:Omp28-related outer membrane protein [Bacteroidia bacterium]